MQTFQVPRYTLSKVLILQTGNICNPKFARGKGLTRIRIYRGFREAEEGVQALL